MSTSPLSRAGGTLLQTHGSEGFCFSGGFIFS